MIPTLQAGQMGRALQAETGGATRPAFANVQLLLHMDGTEGSRTYVDSSSAARTISESGTNNMATAEKKFGTASLTFTTGSGWLTLADASSLQFGAGDFTVEWWAYLSTASGGIGKLNEWEFETLVSGGFRKVRLRLGTSGGAYSDDQTLPAASAHAYALASWVHFAFERFGSTVTAYIDGVAAGSFSFSGTVANTANGVQIGTAPSGAAASSGSYIDDIRITVGEAVYQGDFTPPGAAHPNA